MESLLNIQVDFTRSMALFTRIFDYFDLKNNIVTPNHGESPDISNADIRFNQVTFSYSDAKPLLAQRNFTVPAGKMYALVVSSGAGKSTAANLPSRLYDVTAAA